LLSIDASEGMKEKGYIFNKIFNIIIFKNKTTLLPFMLLIPYNFVINLKCILKFEIFFIVNFFSDFSPYNTLPTFKSPSSGINCTSGLQKILIIYKKILKK